MYIDLIGVKYKYKCATASKKHKKCGSFELTDGIENEYYFSSQDHKLKELGISKKIRPNNCNYTHAKAIL